MASRDDKDKKPKYKTRFDANKLMFGRKDCSNEDGDEDEVYKSEEDRLKRFPSPKGEHAIFHNDGQFLNEKFFLHEVHCYD